MNLTARQFSLLLDEVAAMARADRPLAIGLAELNHRSLGRIGRAAGTLAKQMESGQTPDVAIQQIGGKLGSQAAAAMKALQATGSSEPVSQLAETLRRQSDMRTQMIAGLIYPLITSIFAYAVISLVMTTLVIDHWPTEILQKKDSIRFIGFCIWLRHYFWLPPLVLAVLYFLISIVRRLGLVQLPWLDKSSNDQAWATFCDMLAVQIASGLPLGDAIGISADATGNNSVRRQANSAMIDQAISTGDTSMAGPPATSSVPPMIRWLLQHAKQHTASDTVQQLLVLADWYRHNALRRSLFWIQFAPAFITIVVGGGAALLYCVILLPPLFEGMKQVVQ